MLLRPHQIAPVERMMAILRDNVSAVDLSDTGTGKTYVTACVAAQLKLPTLAVCPKIAISAWESAAAHFGEKFSVINYEMLRTGRTPYGWWDHNPPTEEQPDSWTCQSCQQRVDFDKFVPCYTHHLGIHCIVRKKFKWKYGKFNFHPGVKFLSFDEVHRCGGIDSLNGELLIAAKRQGIKHVGLSATPACTPLQLRALGYSLGLHTLTPRGGRGFYEWAARYECRREPSIGPGVHWLASEKRQNEIMAEINRLIIPSRGVRVRTEDIPGFPERDISAEIYDLQENNAIDKLYAEMQPALEALAKRASLDCAPESALTEILRGRQKLELLKIPIACELARDYLAKGYSVGIFCDFKATLEELSTRLGCKCIIDGSASGVRNRQANIAGFQANTQRLILVQNSAGGIAISLQDLDGNHPRVGIVFPTFDIVVMRQLMGRFHRDGGKSKCFYRVLFVAKSVEEQVYRAWRAKGNNLDALNNFDMIPKKIMAHKVSLATLINVEEKV